MQGYVVLLIAGLVLLLAGHPDAAWIASWFGSVTWTLGVLAWIVLFDSRRRWPGTSAVQRLGYLLSFRRD